MGGRKNLDHGAQAWVRHSEETPGLPRGVAQVKPGHPGQKKLEGSVGSDGYGAWSSLVGRGRGSCVSPSQTSGHSSGVRLRGLTTSAILPLHFLATHPTQGRRHLQGNVPVSHCFPFIHETESSSPPGWLQPLTPSQDWGWGLRKRGGGTGHIPSRQPAGRSQVPQAHGRCCFFSRDSSRIDVSLPQFCLSSPYETSRFHFQLDA